jgi:hypothetical protein
MSRFILTTDLELTISVKNDCFFLSVGSGIYILQLDTMVNLDESVKSNEVRVNLGYLNFLI